MADELTSQQKKDLALNTYMESQAKSFGYGATGAKIGSFFGGPAGTAAGFAIGAAAGTISGLAGLPADIKAMKEANKKTRKAQEKAVLSGLEKQRKKTQQGLQATGGETGQRFVNASEAADFASLGPATQYDTLMSRTYGA